jgi:hypothetical protein
VDGQTQKNFSFLFLTFTFTSHLPPFPFAFELAVAFFLSSNQTNSRWSRPHYHRLSADDASAGCDRKVHLQPRGEPAECLSDDVVGVFDGFGV